MSFKKELKLFLKYRLFYPFIALLPLPFSHGIVKIKVMLEGFFEKSKKNKIQQSLLQIFPGKTPEWYSSQCNQYLHMMELETFDVFTLQGLNKNNIGKLINFSGLDNLASVIDQNRPVLLYSSHYGRLIMPLIALGIAGFKNSCLTADINNPRLPKQQRNFLEFKNSQMKLLMGEEVITRAESLKKLYRLMHQGSILVMIIDAPPAHGDKIIQVPFMGGQLNVSPGILRLARKYDAALIPYFAEETQQGLIGEILPEINIDGLDDLSAMQRLFRPVEERISINPSQWWLWPHLDGIWKKSGT